MLFQSWSLFAFQDILFSTHTGAGSKPLLFDRLHEGIMSRRLLTQALAWLPVESEGTAAGSAFRGCMERQ